MSETAAIPGSVEWPDALYDVLVRQRMWEVPYVPDAGHARLIACCAESPEMPATVVTTDQDRPTGTAVRAACA